MILWAALSGADIVVRSLAVLGAFVVGAWLVNMLFGYFTKNWFKDQKLPPWANWASRMLGGSIFGILMFFWAFGHIGGGTGFNPFGDSSNGGNKAGKPKDKKPEERDKEKEKEKQKLKEPPSTVPPSDTLRVEVLGDKPLSILQGTQTPDLKKRYRVKGIAGLLNLDELKDRTLAYRNSKTGLRVVEIVLYLDGPASSGPPVADLVKFVRDLGGENDRVKIDFYEPGRRAPVE